MAWAPRITPFLLALLSLFHSSWRQDDLDAAVLLVTEGFVHRGPILELGAMRDDE